MKKLALPSLGLALVLLGAGCSTATNTQVSVNNAPPSKPGQTPTPNPNPSPTPTPQPTPEPQPNLQTKIVLKTQNSSGESGLVTFIAVAPKTSLSPAVTKVIISLTGEAAGWSQPAHVHIGSCPNPGAVKYPLNPVVNGTSETSLNVAFDDLFDGKTKMAVNVHKSASEISKYVACADMN